MRGLPAFGRAALGFRGLTRERSSAAACQRPRYARPWHARLLGPHASSQAARWPRSRLAGNRARTLGALVYAASEALPVARAPSLRCRWHDPNLASAQRCVLSGVAFAATILELCYHDFRWLSRSQPAQRVYGGIDHETGRFFLWLLASRLMRWKRQRKSEWGRWLRRRWWSGWHGWAGRRRERRLKRDHMRSEQLCRVLLWGTMPSWQHGRRLREPRGRMCYLREEPDMPHDSDMRRGSKQQLGSPTRPSVHRAEQQWKCLGR